MNNKINEFINYIEVQKNYSKKTILSYEGDLKKFSEYLKKEGIDYLDLKYSDIRFYFNYLDKFKYSKNTICKKISTLRSFYKYLARNKIININPFSLTSLPKKDKLLPKFLYNNELEEMLNACDLNTPLGQRDRLVIELLYATGARVSELVEIKLQDINFNDNEIRVLGKGRKERIVFYGKYAKKYLDLYLSNGRKKLNKTDCSYLILNNAGGKITTRGIESIISKIIKKTSVKTNITPHSLRHTFATDLLNEGCDILVVQELLGHESLRATQVYTHITNEELKNTYFKTHPRNMKK